jgi:hypothetical protein
MARLVAIIALVTMLGGWARRARVQPMLQTEEIAEMETKVEPNVGKSFGDGCPKFVILQKETCFDDKLQDAKSDSCCDKLRECETAANDLTRAYFDRLLVYRDKCGIDRQRDVKYGPDGSVTLLTDDVCSEKCQSLEVLKKPTWHLKEEHEEVLRYCDEERLTAFYTKMEQAPTHLLNVVDHAWSQCCPTGYHHG